MRSRRVVGNARKTTPNKPQTRRRNRILKVGQTSRRHRTSTGVSCFASAACADDEDVAGSNPARATMLTLHESAHVVFQRLC